MSQKFAVLYYSVNGTTKETVDKINKETAQTIAIFDLKQNIKVNLNEYDQVFVGCGIYTSKISNKVVAFFKNNKEILATKKVSLFLHGLISEDNYMDIVSNDLIRKHDVKFDQIIYLGGKLDINKQNFFIKPILLSIAKKHNLDPVNANNLNDTRLNDLINCF